MTKPSAFKLSICIPTFNRAAFIGATLDSIISQTTSECEIVISDNASTDNTEQVVAEYARRFDNLRYVRQDTNNGLDRNFNCAVELARGEYCWLMTDDDLLKPGAVARVLEALYRDLSLLVVNVEVRDFSMSKVLQCRRLNFESDRIYGQGEMDRLFVELDETVMYIGNVIIKRAIWIARERERYYGSLFIHVGVIFQESLPGEVLVIAEPFVSYRTGNVQTFWQQASEIFFAKWPSLVGSLALSESTKREIRSAQPWSNPQWLLMLRGRGFYSLAEYRRWIRPQLRSLRQRLPPVLITLLPGVLVNACFVFYYTARKNGSRVQVMRQSRFHPRNWRAFKRAS